MESREIEAPTLAVNRVKPLKIQIPHVSESWLRDGMWRGRPCWIVGGGPSLGELIRSGKLSEIRTCPIIGVNVAWMDPPYPSVVCAKDFRVLDQGEDQYRDLWRELGEKRIPAHLDQPQVQLTDRVHASRRKWTGTYWVDSLPAPEWGRTLKALDLKDGAGLMQAGYTGVMAINLAEILGADPIFLLGFDCRPDSSGRANWHDRYPPDWRSVGPWPDKMVNNFTLASQLAKAKVYNVCPESWLPCFKKITFEEALCLAREKSPSPERSASS